MKTSALVAAATVLLGGALLLTQNVNAQATLTQRPPKLSVIAPIDLVAVSVGSKTIRIDTNSGATSWLFFETGSNAWSWKPLKDVGDAPVAGTDRYQLLQGASGGSDFIRLDKRSGKTWILVTKSLLPEWQVVTQN